MPTKDVLLDRTLTTIQENSRTLGSVVDAMKESSSTRNLQEVAFVRLVDVTEKQTAAIEDLKKSFDFLKSKWIKATIVLLILLFIAVGGFTILRAFTDLNINKILGI